MPQIMRGKNMVQVMERGVYEFLSDVTEKAQYYDRLVTVLSNVAGVTLHQENDYWTVITKDGDILYQGHVYEDALKVIIEHIKNDTA